MKKRKKP